MLVEMNVKEGVWCLSRMPTVADLDYGLLYYYFVCIVLLYMNIFFVHLQDSC